MLIINNKALKVGNKWLNPAGSPTPTPTPSDEVIIGTQTWKSVNLAIDDGGEGITIIDNVTANNVNFGTQYYYTWDAAKRVASSISGWHLPTMSEWATLQTYIGGSDYGTKLGSTSGWTYHNGTNDYGFNAYPVVTYKLDINDIDRDNLGQYAQWWAYDNESGFFAYGLQDYMPSQRSGLRFERTGPGPTYYACSVRLIKDT